MVSIDDKFMNFSVGWIVEYEDGTVIYEGDKEWREVPKKGIKTLSFKWHDKLWAISGKENYVQFKRGYVAFSPSGGFGATPTLSQHCIGYYDEKGRKVIYRIDDASGNMNLDVKEG
jgi:hypothetical protein